MAGIDLHRFPAWNNESNYPNDPARNARALKLLIDSPDASMTQLVGDHEWIGETSQVEEGDMVIAHYRTTGDGHEVWHSGVVASIEGSATGDDIMIVQASYSQEAVNMISLAEWSIGAADVYAGHIAPSDDPYSYNYYDPEYDGGRKAWPDPLWRE